MNVVNTTCNEVLSSMCSGNGPQAVTACWPVGIGADRCGGQPVHSDPLLPDLVHFWFLFYMPHP